MKKQLCVFKCDSCGKESPIREEGHTHSTYPYEEGWIYLYDFSFKDKKNESHTLKDQHFCSVGCMEMGLYNKIHKGGENGSRT